MLIDVQGLVVGQSFLVSLNVVKNGIFIFFLYCEVEFVFVVVDELLDVDVVSLRSLASNYGFLNNLIWKFHLKLITRLLRTL
jgi:hypothetical protein